MADFDKRQLLEMTPRRYLAQGFTGESGRPLPALSGLYATAASTQLRAYHAAPQELAAAFEALKATLPLHTGYAPDRFAAAVDEAFDIAEEVLGKGRNRGIETWLRECGAAVKDEADIPHLMHHVQATVRQYAALVSLESSR
jgi:hypothetical protein